jgi:phosphonate transport system substrate-binding protein
MLRADAWHAQRRELVFVVHPYDTPSRIYSRFRPLTLYLAGVLERPIKLVIASTYDEQMAMIVDGRADLTYIGPTPYVQARDRAPIRILAGEAENGQAFYQSAIVVRAKSPINSLADLKGKAHGLRRGDLHVEHGGTDPDAGTGGVRLGDLAGHAQLDRHERVALSVLHGDFDAGGLRLDIARQYLPRGLKIIASSQPLPPHVIACSASFPVALEARARAALIAPDDHGLSAFRAWAKRQASSPSMIRTTTACAACCAPWANETALAQLLA